MAVFIARYVGLENVLWVASLLNCALLTPLNNNMMSGIIRSEKLNAIRIFIDNEDINVLNKVQHEIACMDDKCNEFENALGLVSNTVCETVGEWRCELYIIQLLVGPLYKYARKMGYSIELQVEK